MFARKRVVWSPVEIEYLTVNRKMPIAQLTIALNKSISAIKNQLRIIDGKPVPKSKQNSRRSVIGKREDLNKFFRSSYEANFARILNHLKWSWEFETQVFFFQGVKRGTVSYLPDFKVYLPDGKYIWVETKGYLDKKGKTALVRFRKFYPDEFVKLVLICDRPGSKTDLFLKEMKVPNIMYMKELEKEWKPIIPNWE